MGVNKVVGLAARGKDIAKSTADPAANVSTIDFARDVQPILASKCIRCHGPETREAGLRLDDRKVAVGELESGNRAIVSGRPDASELVRRITAEESERMPPEEPPLDAAYVATLRQWIAEGAKWPDHWAYQPLHPVTPPIFGDIDSLSQNRPKTGGQAHFAPKTPQNEPVPDGSTELDRWCRTPIDRFILAELRKRGLLPAAEADRRTLLRRVYFDVIGLPPNPEEVEAFLNDKSANAYEKLIDRLLASPQYGERWARHWLDVVHYADSHGFEHDMPRSAWPYRDYVIEAFNSDMPYRQFIREQVAGDVLAPDDPRALAATGFLATGPWDESAL